MECMRDFSGEKPRANDNEDYVTGLYSDDGR